MADALTSWLLSARREIGLSRNGFPSAPGYPLREYLLNLHGRTLRISTPGGIAVSRSVLDLALVQAAVQAGAQFLQGVTGSLVPACRRRPRQLTLTLCMNCEKCSWRLPAFPWRELGSPSGHHRGRVGSKKFAADFRIARRDGFNSMDRVACDLSRRQCIQSAQVGFNAC